MLGTLLYHTHYFNTNASIPGLFDQKLLLDTCDNNTIVLESGGEKIHKAFR